MKYFEVYHLHVKGNDEEFYSLNSVKPFPLISNREIVEIKGEKYMVFKREQARSETEVSVNYYVTIV
jgi:hypothetical protein